MFTADLQGAHSEDSAATLVEPAPSKAAAKSPAVPGSLGLLDGFSGEEVTDVMASEDLKRAVEDARANTASELSVMNDTQETEVDDGPEFNTGSTTIMPLSQLPDAVPATPVTPEAVAMALEPTIPLGATGSDFSADGSEGEFGQKTALALSAPAAARFPWRELQRFVHSQRLHFARQPRSVRILAAAGATLAGALVGFLLLWWTVLADPNRFVVAPYAMTPLPQTQDVEAPVTVVASESAVMLRGSRVVVFETIGSTAVVRDMAGRVGYLPLNALARSAPEVTPESVFADCYRGILEDDGNACTERAQDSYNGCRHHCDAAPAREACLSRCQSQLQACARGCMGEAQTNPQAPELEEPVTAPEATAVAAGAGVPDSVAPAVVEAGGAPLAAPPNSGKQVKEATPAAVSRSKKRSRSTRRRKKRR